MILINLCFVCLYVILLYIYKYIYIYMLPVEYIEDIC